MTVKKRNKQDLFPDQKKDPVGRASEIGQGMDTHYLKDKTYNYLLIHCRGKNRAITLDVLGIIISPASPVSWRLTADMISELRREGKPIAAGGNGIFIPNTPEEKKACLRTIFRRAFNTLRVARALAKNFDRIIVDEIREEFNCLESGQLEIKL